VSGRLAYDLSREGEKPVLRPLRVTIMRV
jgi:hypothetical protein